MKKLLAVLLSIMMLAMPLTSMAENSVWDNAARQETTITIHDLNADLVAALGGDDTTMAAINDLLAALSLTGYQQGDEAGFDLNLSGKSVLGMASLTTAAEENQLMYVSSTLLGGVTAEQLKMGATVEVGGIELALNKPNYGLEDWQTAFVDITVTVKDKAGNIVSDKIDNLINDTTYTIEVTVAPKNEGSATQKTGSNEGKINVFKPELTFKDSEGYYGAAAPTTYADNLTKTEWKHPTATGDILGIEPKLDITCTPEAGKIDNNKINTKQDIGVDVAVKIGNADVTSHTTFKHQDCAGQTCTLPENMEFLIHVKTCQLTITKSGGASNESAMQRCR